LIEGVDGGRAVLRLSSAMAASECLPDKKKLSGLTPLYSAGLETVIKVRRAFMDSLWKSVGERRTLQNSGPHVPRLFVIPRDIVAAKECEKRLSILLKRLVILRNCSKRTICRDLLEESIRILYVL